VTFSDLLRSKKVLICCGSGGVGKTTLSAALGVLAAENGMKALVLTIDPARRLATSLGLETLGDSENQVAAGEFPGELHAGMLDMKKTFDDFIIRLAPSPAVAERVLSNNVYKQLSTALNGSQEYTAMEKLLQVVSTGKYDIIILDTPPTKHAIDFLNAPVKIHTLFQDSIIKWFLMPFTTLDKMSLGLMNRGTKMAFKAFEKLAGSEFLSTLTDFFASIRDWQKALRDRTAEVHRLLTSAETGFVLVTGFNAVKIEEARFFERSLKKGGYFLSAIIVNRAFPLWGRSEIGSETVAEISPGPAGLAYEKLRKYFDDMQNYYQSQQSAFRNFAGEVRTDALFARLPDYDQDVHDIENLRRLAHRLQEVGVKGKGI
jgi:anion-transporting  ArsA/GET3 family ATPase